MPLSWDDDEPRLLPDSDDYDDVLRRAAQKRRDKLSRLAVLATLPVVAAAVTFALRPIVPSDDAKVRIAEQPDVTRSELPTPSLSASPSTTRAPLSPSPTASPSPRRKPRSTAALPPPSVRPSATTPLPRPPQPVRVEAEAGEFVDPDCGDGNERMEVRTAPAASGGYDVFHPASGCASAFADRKGRAVTRIRFVAGGFDGEICGYFVVEGSQSGSSDSGCWNPDELVTVDVDAAYVGGEDTYRIVWTSDSGTPAYVNAYVDYHELG